MTEPTTTTTDPVRAQIDAMTLQDKIGQILMPVVRGTGVDTVSGADVSYNTALGGFETPAELVAAYRLGGIMYLGPNVESPAQVGEFSAGLQAVAVENGLPPLLVAADQEGGRVRRIGGEGITVVGSARSLAGDGAAVYENASLTGQEMRAIGINVVFAPVADVVRSDVGVIGDRSYGSDPTLVGEMVAASVGGLQQGGVAAVAKHWPGHGATEVDSHLALPVVDSTEIEWRSIDLPPFVSAVEAGVSALMVGHLAVPSLGAAEPATISPLLTEDLIRTELGFDGVLFTDAMDMRALDGIDEAELAVLVLEAGIDIMLVPPDLAAAVAGISEAVSTGRITERRLDASVARILGMKRDLGLID
jgi:beta-N-acetylhexosaminidase